MRRDVFQHHDETRLRSGLVDHVGHAIVERVEILAEVRGQGVLRCDQFQHVLLALGFGQVGVQEVVPQMLGRGLQVFHAIGANRLNDIGSYVTKWRVHLRVSFYGQS
ncbi:hypothetical protein D9M68_791910 [compost metagenome]